MNVKLVIKKSDDILMYNSNVKYNFFEDSKYISEAALKDIFMNIISGTRIFILHSPTGSGKTTIILRIIKFYGKNMIAEDITLNDINILSIVSRRSMSGAHQHAFAELKLKSYLDDPTEDNKQIRSLEHLAQLKKTYSIVILDEINSLISHFYSQTMNGKRRASFVNLCRIISNASLIIACDANITLLTLNFFTPKLISNNDVYHYRNRYKNKQNINMMMYYSDEGTETAKIKEFCKLIKDDVEKKKSVLIFSDSKDIGTLIESILSAYNIDKNYIKLINKDHGTIEEITKFNEIFLNKCAISSPKIIYGVDILINYDAIFCVYKYTSNCNSMGALEYHQQYSRARNTKAVKILILDPYYEKRYNNFVCYAENKNKETQEYEIVKKNHQMMAKKYNLIDDLCSHINMNGISIDFTSIFADIHFAKTWFDALFTTNKFQLVKLLAEEAGYNITAHKLNVVEDGKGHGKAVKNDKILVNSICSQIYDTDTIDSLSEDKKRIGYNQYEQINMRSKLLGMQFTKEQRKEIILDDKKFNAYINKKYLDMTEDEFNKTSLILGNNDIAHVIKDNKIINKVKTLTKIEKVIGMQRFKINEIAKDDKLDEIKEGLLAEIDNIVMLFDGMESKKKLTERLTNKINYIKYNDQLQCFIADCYNSVGEIVSYTCTKITYDLNKKTTSRMKYTKFKLQIQ